MSRARDLKLEKKEERALNKMLVVLDKEAEKKCKTYGQKMQ